MGESQARRWRWLGTWYAYRNRGRDTLETVQPWIKIAMGGAFLSGYRNLGTLNAWESVGIGLGIIVLAEALMLGLGRFDFRNGVIHEQTRLGNAQDPWKVETEVLLREIRDAVARGDVWQTSGLND